MSINLSSDSIKEELRLSKTRWALYLSRAPIFIWNVATYPVAIKVAVISEYVPLIGKPLVQYIMAALAFYARVII